MKFIRDNRDASMVESIVLFCVIALRSGGFQVLRQDCGQEDQRPS